MGKSLILALYYNILILNNMCYCIKGLVENFNKIRIIKIFVFTKKHYLCNSPRHTKHLISPSAEP